MNVYQYLANQKELTPLPEEELHGLSEEHKQVVREFERTGIEGERRQLRDILERFTGKYQFARQYKILRDDFENTFADPDAANPHYPPDVNKLIRKAAMRAIEWKLNAMEGWFWIVFYGGKWDDPSKLPDFREIIERHATGGTGCAVALLALVLLSGIGLSWFLLATSLLA